MILVKIPGAPNSSVASSNTSTQSFWWSAKISSHPGGHLHLCTEMTSTATTTEPSRDHLKVAGPGSAPSWISPVEMVLQSPAAARR
jgi:hypothetical protein